MRLEGWEPEREEGGLECDGGFDDMEQFHLEIEVEEDAWDVNSGGGVTLGGGRAAGGGAAVLEEAQQQQVVRKLRKKLLRICRLEESVQPAAAAGALLPLQGHVFHMSLNRQSRAAAR
jgi:hypothetical protein